jgi:hypothetical protein
MCVRWDRRWWRRSQYFWSAVDGPEVDEAECRVCLWGFGCVFVGTVGGGVVGGTSDQGLTDLA